MGAHFEALDEGVLLVPSDPRYTPVGFNLVCVQVCGSTVQFDSTWSVPRMYHVIPDGWP